jgi:hypothetical protein
MALKDKLVVLLNPERCQTLEQRTRSGAHATRAPARARILLMADGRRPAGSTASPTAPWRPA